MYVYNVIWPCVYRVIRVERGGSLEWDRGDDNVDDPEAIVLRKRERDNIAA